MELNNKNVEFTYVRGPVSGFMFDIDGAVCMHDMDILKLRSAGIVSVDRNNEYKRCFVPTGGEGKKGEEYVNWCSKDGNEWFVCMTAFIGNDSINLYELRERLKKEMAG